MFRRTMLATVLLLAAAPITFAQPAPPPPGGPAHDRPDRDRVDGPRGEGRERARHGGEDRRGPRQMHGGRHEMGPRQVGAFYHFDLATGGSMTVRCGAEPLERCIDGARQLMEAASGTGASASPRPEGPREAAPATPMPPAGEAPPLPEALSGGHVPADAPAPAN